MSKKYSVSVVMTDIVEVEADTAEEAEMKVCEMEISEIFGSDAEFEAIAEEVEDED